MVSYLSFAGMLGSIDLKLIDRVTAEGERERARGLMGG